MATYKDVFSIHATPTHTHSHTLAGIFGKKRRKKVLIG